MMIDNGYWPMNEPPAIRKRTPEDFFDQIDGVNGWAPWELEEQK